MNEIREYDAYFTFLKMSDEQVQEVNSYFKEHNFIVDVSSESLEFESTGRDDDRLVLDLFKKFAKLVKSAEGELRCAIDDEKEDPHFEFFTIKDEQLIRQMGYIVRDEGKVIV